jgi:hypothetical protein
MDPYLEGYLWPDVHHALAGKIRQQLTPHLRPRYVARLEVYVVQDTMPQSEIGIMYPDVEVAMVTAGREQQQRVSSLPVASDEGDVSVAVEPRSRTKITPSLLIPTPIEVRVVTVEVRDAAHNKLVTCIEILSPINKREPGLTAYLQKRQRLYAGGVHLLEIDLLRRGTRPFLHPRIPDTPYCVTLTRAREGHTEVWPISLHQMLPTVAVPLRHPDPDAPLDLAHALAEVYDEAAYELSIDYNQPPPPPPLGQDDTSDE